MKPLFFSLIFAIEVVGLLGQIATAQDVADEFIFQDYDRPNADVKRSHNIFYINYDGLDYRTQHRYTGDQYSIDPDDSVLFSGPGLSYARNMRISSRFWTSTIVTGHYMQHHDRRIRKASQEIDYTVSYSDEKHAIYGVQLAQSFQARLGGPTLYWEPFFQIGIGVAQMTSNVEYFYNDLVNEEAYSGTVEEDLLYQNVAVGFNIVTRGGLMSYFRVQKNVLTIGERNFSGSEVDYSTTGSGTVTPVENTETVSSPQDKYSFSLGMGYIF